MKGDYHKFGAFASGVSALPRIVTLHDLNLVKQKGDNSSNSMVMETTAKTYRYLELEEIAPKKPERASKRGKK